MAKLDRFSRCKLLFGDKFKLLENAKVLILGVGGVGGFCLDSLSRSGVGNISIVDYDSFEITNQNRQIGSENLGEQKVFALAKIYDVNPINQKIDSFWVNEFNFKEFDVVIDAIDDLNAKVAVAKKTSFNLISSMGAAKRVNPTKIQIADIWKTKNDPFARAFRTRLKKENFNAKFDVVYSTEEPKCENLGSFASVTGAFGLTLASLCVQKILNKT